MATLFNNRILNVELGASVQPVIGGGGISGSFAGATGTVAIVSVRMRDDRDGALLYTIYDVNGLNNRFGDPVTTITGETSVRWNKSSKVWEAVIGREIEAIANRNTGEMNVAIVLNSPDFQQTATTFVTVPGRILTRERVVVEKDDRPAGKETINRDNLADVGNEGNAALRIAVKKGRNFENELTKEDGPGCCTPELEWDDEKWWEDTRDGRLEIGTVVSYQGCCYRVVNINQTKDPVTGLAPGVVEGTPPAEYVRDEEGAAKTFYSTAYGTGEVDLTTDIEQRRSDMFNDYQKAVKGLTGQNLTQAIQRFKENNAAEIERIKPGGSMRLNDVGQGHEFPFKYIKGFDSRTGAWGDKLILPDIKEGQGPRSVAIGPTSTFIERQRIQIGCREYIVHDTGNLDGDELDIFCGDDKELYNWLGKGPGSKMWQKRGNQSSTGLPNVKTINNGWVLCPCCGPVSTPIELSFNSLYIYGTSVSGPDEGKSGFWYPLFKTKEEAAAANPVVAGNNTPLFGGAKLRPKVLPILQELIPRGGKESIFERRRRKKRVQAREKWARERQRERGVPMPPPFKEPKTQKQKSNPDFFKDQESLKDWPCPPPWPWVWIDGQWAKGIVGSDDWRLTDLGEDPYVERLWAERAVPPLFNTPDADFIGDELQMKPGEVKWELDDAFNFKAGGLEDFRPVGAALGPELAIPWKWGGKNNPFPKGPPWYKWDGTFYLAWVPIGWPCPEDEFGRRRFRTPEELRMGDGLFLPPWKEPPRGWESWDNEGMLDFSPGLESHDIFEPEEFGPEGPSLNPGEFFDGPWGELLGRVSPGVPRNTSPEGWKRTTTPAGKQAIVPITAVQQRVASLTMKDNSSSETFNTHTHTFKEFPGQIFYMPSNLQYHGVPTPPPTPGVPGQLYTQLLPISETTRNCYTPTHVEPFPFSITDGNVNTGESAPSTSQWYNAIHDNWATREWVNSVGQSVPTDVVTITTVVKYKEKCYKVTNVPLVQGNLDIEPGAVAAGATSAEDQPADCTCDEGGCVLYLPDRAGVPIEEWIGKYPAVFPQAVGSRAEWMATQQQAFNLPEGWKVSTEDPRAFDDYDPKCWYIKNNSWLTHGLSLGNVPQVRWVQKGAGGRLKLGLELAAPGDWQFVENRVLPAPPEGAVLHEKIIWCKKCRPRFVIPEWEPPLTQEERESFRAFLDAWDPTKMSEEELEEALGAGEEVPGFDEEPWAHLEVTPNWDEVAEAMSGQWEDITEGMSEEEKKYFEWIKDPDEMTRRAQLYEKWWLEDMKFHDMDPEEAREIINDPDAWHEKMEEELKIEHEEQATMYKEVPCCGESVIDGDEIETEETPYEGPEMTGPSGGTYQPPGGTGTSTGGGGYAGY